MTLRIECNLASLMRLGKEFNQSFLHETYVLTPLSLECSSVTLETWVGVGSKVGPAGRIMRPVWSPLGHAWVCIS